MIRLLKPYYDLKKLYRHYREISALYKVQRIENVDKQVQLWNWWDEEKTRYWLRDFIENSGILKNTNEQMALCSVFGEREVLGRVRETKIFFSGENLHAPEKASYADALLGDNRCKLSLGFDEIDDERYLRFPLWLTYMFEPRMDEKQIRERCAQLRYPELGKRDKFGCLIARADISGIRTVIYEGLSAIGNVDCPSGLFHNDDSLEKEYRDDKVKYMRQYTFNVCPENSNAEGYCTEKVFEAIAAGCIPIYWGCNNMPEQKILNQNAIIFWDQESKGVKAIEQIRELCADDKKLDVFMKQPRLLPNAEEEIMRMMNELYNRLKSMYR